ncbi:serine/threonine-protein kinase [Sphaerisporangium rubeum]|uniref:serine/threonine-protein kinase n=1 Tax=Sphaerisporangium rubeum TaxID=321317 RepID=UPI0031E07DBA
MTAQGRRVAGRYRLVEEIGRGGMGVVWVAHDELLDRRVAVKEVVYRGVGDADREAFNRRTIREARAAGRLDHPSVVVVHDVVEEDGRPWIVMQLVRSRSLGQVLKEQGPLDPHTVAGIGANVLDALRAAHAAGVLHRDVKPENVLLTEGGRVVLTDFGIATMTRDAGLTTTGNLTGTPAFMPPERLRGHPAVPESDLWSLGATLYAAVEGRPPFDRGAPVPTMAAVLSDDPAPVRRAGPLAPVLEGLLRKEPDLRMTAADAAQALHRVAASGPSADPRGPAPHGGHAAPGLTLPDGRAARDASEHSPTGPPAARPGTPVPPGPHGTGPGDAYRHATGPDGVSRRPAGPRRGVRAAVVTALVLPLVAGLGAAGYYGYQRLSVTGGVAGTPGVPSGTASAETSPTTAPTGASPQAEPSARPSVSPSVKPTGQPSARPVVVPPGWRLHEDRLGFTIALPPRWVETTRQKTRVTFREPGSGTYLLVDTTPWTAERPVDALRAVARESTARGWLPGYRLVGLTAGSFMGWQAADWEFTWRMKTGTAHVMDRAFVTPDGRQYALYWHTSDESWEAEYSRFVRFAGTFRPDPL